MRDHARSSPTTLGVQSAASSLLALFPAAALAQSPFASRVVSFDPAPGQFVNIPEFNDPARALGPPIGGGAASPDTAKLVSLGGFGGAITLAFDHPILNQPPSPENPLGLDLIIFSNAFLVAGDPARRWAEPGVIEVAPDLNRNGLADDPWFVIRGSHLPPRPIDARASQTWDADTLDPALPPANPAWIPPGHAAPWSTSTFELLDPIFQPVVLVTSSASEIVWGYADCSPTCVLGDLDSDGAIDDPAAAPESFYVVPDDPFTLGITPGSAGGDAINLDWAVDPATGSPASLIHIDFIRISTALRSISPLFGERSTELSAVAEVRLAPPHDPRDFNADGAVNPDDLGDFINAYFLADSRADFNADGDLNPDDLGDFINAYFS
ncbi:MAG: hypothetical protein AB7K52_14725 [Phycisphaerales bacterium]